MPAPYVGNCLCGQVRFQLNAEPMTLYACHCTGCQRRSGGALLLSMWVHRESLQVLEGAPVLVSSVANDGRERTTSQLTVPMTTTNAMMAACVAFMRTASPMQNTIPSAASSFPAGARQRSASGPWRRSWINAKQVAA